MAEQHTRPPDMSPTEMPQPSVQPAGCYPSLLYDQTAQPTDLWRYSGGTFTQPSTVDITDHQPVQRPTIEHLIEGLWSPARSDDFTTLFLEDRLAVEGFSLSDTLRLIKDRLAIYRQNLYELELAKSQIRTTRKQWMDPQDRFGHLPDPEGVLIQQGIEAQLRAERLSAWKDISNLRQQLPERWQQYLAATRQAELVGSGYDPSPSDGWGDPGA